MYRIFGNFYDDLIFAFFVITFRKQNILYAKIIFVLFAIKKILIVKNN